jgi:acid phosphatase type 7
VIDLGLLQPQWDAWFEASGDVLTRRVLLPAHGNHEFFAPHYFAQFSLPGNEQWFSTVYGDLQLVVLNDTVVDTADIDAQAAYLDQVYGSSVSPWRAVMHHRTAYGTSTVHGSALDLQAAWVPKFDVHGVDLVLAGHNHAYERSVPLRGGAEAPAGEGTTYITAGGAGADLYTSFDAEWFGAVALATEHYLVADFGPTEVHAVVRDLSGNTIDEFTIPR